MNAKEERCWRCCGFRQVMRSSSESNSGYEPCPECKGTGYGESLETMWKRKGITPDFGKKGGSK